MTKRNADNPLNPPPTAMRTTDRVREVGNQDVIYWQWWARMRRTIASFVPEKAKRSPECSDAESKPLTVTEQIYVLEQWERLDRGCGFYQQPLRHRANIDPLDQLLCPAREEVKDAETRRPDKPSEED
jgi:hypothetical protein